MKKKYKFKTEEEMNEFLWKKNPNRVLYIQGVDDGFIVVVEGKQEEEE